MKTCSQQLIIEKIFEDLKIMIYDEHNYAKIFEEKSVEITMVIYFEFVKKRVDDFMI